MGLLDFLKMRKELSAASGIDFHTLHMMADEEIAYWHAHSFYGDDKPNKRGLKAFRILFGTGQPKLDRLVRAVRHAPKMLDELSETDSREARYVARGIRDALADCAESDVTP
jgi:hypothetical protein